MPNRKTNDKTNDWPGDGDRDEHRAAEPAGPAAEAARTAAGDVRESRDARDPAEALDAAEAEIARLKDQLLRALAETENVRRRGQREREDASKFAVTAFAKDLLPVADNLRRALESIPAEALETDESLRSLAEGVAMTERQMFAAFERHGIRRVDPLGERFDSNFHQAMFEVPGSGQPAGTVVQLMQPGYLLHDRLLRPAMVGVAKGEPGPKAGPEGGTEGGGGEAPPGGRVDTTA